MRRPTEKLAGCVWLPRFIDKARLHLAGTLPADFIQPFCHPLGTDGLFLKNFEIEKEEILQVIADSKGDDAFVEKWFRERASYTPEKVAAWNELGPNIGREGYPAHRGFLWILRQYYGGVAPDPRVVSAFTAIAYDEGYLDQI